MGFVLDGLDSEAYDRTYSDRDLLHRITDYFRPYTRQMVIVEDAQYAKYLYVHNVD